MITQIFVPQVDGMDLEEMWFQLDGATRHTSYETMLFLHKTFPVVSSPVGVTRIGHLDRATYMYNGFGLLSLGLICFSF